MSTDTIVSITLLCGMSGVLLVFASAADGIWRAGRVTPTRAGREQYRHYDRVGDAFACAGVMLLMVFVAGVARLAGLI